MAADRINLIDFERGWLNELIPMWRASFENGVGITDPHPLADQLRYFVDEVEPRNTIRLALRDGALVGFVAASRVSIAQLYVRVGFQHQGIGAALLRWAKMQSAGHLWLHTFERNRRACAFYEKHGFVVAARGFEPMWQLEDVRYEWCAPGAGTEAPTK